MDNKILVEQFVKGFEETKNIVRNLQNDLQKNSLDIVSISSKLGNIEEKVNQLLKTVEGNNDKSIPTRIFLLERSQDELNNSIKEYKKEKNRLSEEKNRLSLEDKRGKTQLKIAVVTSMLGLFTAMVTALLSIILN